MAVKGKCDNEGYFGPGVYVRVCVHACVRVSVQVTVKD